LKVVFVVGFYDAVRVALEKSYSAQLGAGTLVFVRQISGKPIPDLQDFNSRFSDLVPKCTSIKVLLAILRNYEWVEEKVCAVIERMRQRHPDVKIELSAPPRAEAGVGVAPELIKEIEEFGLPEPEAITIQILEEVLGTTHVLCMCLEGKAGFSEALVRANFPPESTGRFFTLRGVSPGRNSNLMNIASQEAKHCEHLLYAWDGLRTLKPDVKRKFSGKAYEAQTAAKVIEIFRRWILGEWKRLNDQTANADGEAGD
jgi:hypothetical protein